MKAKTAYEVWCVVFCGGMAVLFGFTLIRKLHLHVSSESWIRTTATVVAIGERPKSATVHYKFVSHGVEYTGDRLSFFSASSIQDKAIVNKRYRVGHDVDVFFNPEDPNQSVIERRRPRFVHLWIYVTVVGVSITMASFFLYRLRARAPNGR